MSTPYRGDLTLRDGAARPHVGKKTLIGDRSVRRLLLEEMAMARRAGDRERFRVAWMELAFICGPPGRAAVETD